MPRDLKLLNTRTLMWHQKEFIVELRSAASSLSNLSRSCERTRARDFVIHPSIHLRQPFFCRVGVSQSVAGGLGGGWLPSDLLFVKARGPPPRKTPIVRSQVLPLFPSAALSLLSYYYYMPDPQVEHYGLEFIRLVSAPQYGTYFCFIKMLVGDAKSSSFERSPQIERCK